MSEYLFQAALRSSVLLTLGLLLWPLVPAQMPLWRRRLLLGFVLVLLIVPFLPVAAPVQVGPAFGVQSSASVPWIPLLWLIGSAVALIRLGWQAYGVNRILRRATPLGMIDMPNCQMEVRETPLLDSPCVAGWRRSILLVPLGSSEWNNRRWQCVLWHEREHAMQHDVLAIWMVRLISALYWWNPLVHLAARQFHIESEAACDMAVLRSGTQARDYVETLLSFTQRTSLPVLSITGKSPLRRRIERFLLAPVGSLHGRIRLGVSVVAALLVAVFGSLCGLRHAVPELSAVEEEVQIRLSANPFPSSEPMPVAPAVSAE